jgi:hypothetical protein
MERWLRLMRTEVLWNCVPAGKSLEQSAGLVQVSVGPGMPRMLQACMFVAQNLTSLRDAGKASDEPGCEE